MASGYLGVSKPTTREYYDLSAVDRLTGEHVTFQVKTFKRRDDRPGNWMKIDAKMGNGERYSPDNSADYYVGVLIDNGEAPRVFVTENRNISEYWLKEGSASERWVELPVALDRGTLVDELTEIPSGIVSREITEVYQ